MKKVMRAGTYFAFRRVLLAETELNDMKTNRRIALATLGALCMLSSCTLDDQMAIPTPVWEGEFKVQMINGSTGETEDHVGDIFVYFRNEKLQCVVEKSIRGLFAGNRYVYETRWAEDGKTFDLVQTYGEHVLRVYDGALEGDAMTLNWYDDKGDIAGTYQLKKRKN